MNRTCQRGESVCGQSVERVFIGPGMSCGLGIYDLVNQVFSYGTRLGPKVL